MRFKEDFKIIKILDIGTYKDWSKYLVSSYILHILTRTPLIKGSKHVFSRSKYFKDLFKQPEMVLLSFSRLLFPFPH